MNTTASVQLEDAYLDNKPGAQLKLMRTEKGYTAEYVAGKLHLRVHLIELLEADEYDKMPEPVFIKGYLRGYAKLLEIAPEPFVDTFNRYHATERRMERALWQGRKRSYKAYKAENTVRWVTLGLSLFVFAAVLMWWTKTKDDQMQAPTSIAREEVKPQVHESDASVSLVSNLPSILPSVDEKVESAENTSE